ncbi:hypothetical protein [Bacillus sp. REN10]|uniref:hypothetical protein n=1 Tax=Bacillus sp. REN10 TaxID=2782541 RepID=UPI00193B002A|nr:hypothetical protein [Bacillus sp. REN10]
MSGVQQIFCLPIHKLRQNRQYQTIDLHRMYKQGEIDKDYKGYYMFEVNENQYGQKLYFEDSYLYMENRMKRLYEDANKIYHQLVNGTSDTKKKWCAELLKTDYQLMLLCSLYCGTAYQPFMSVKQMAAWLNEQMAMDIYCEVLSSQEHTPLCSIEIVKEWLSEPFSCQLFQNQYSDFETTNKKENGLLQLLPYRMKKRK